MPVCEMKTKLRRSEYTGKLSHYGDMCGAAVFCDELVIFSLCSPIVAKNVTKLYDNTGQ